MSQHFAIKTHYACYGMAVLGSVGIAPQYVGTHQLGDQSEALTSGEAAKGLFAGKCFIEIQDG